MNVDFNATIISDISIERGDDFLPAKVEDLSKIQPSMLGCGVCTMLSHSGCLRMWNKTPKCMSQERSLAFYMEVFPRYYRIEG